MIQFDEHIFGNGLEPPTRLSFFLKNSLFCFFKSTPQKKRRWMVKLDELSEFNFCDCLQNVNFQGCWSFFFLGGGAVFCFWGSFGWWFVKIGLIFYTPPKVKKVLWKRMLYNIGLKRDQHLSVFFTPDVGVAVLFAPARTVRDNGG